MSVKVVVFDFDGVLVRDSDAVFKKEAWKIVFSDYFGKYEKLLSEAMNLFGNGKAGGRKEMFMYVYENLGHSVEKSNTLTEIGMRKFDKYVQGKIMEAGLASGVMEIFEYLFQKKLPVYINSSTPKSALETSVHNLNIDKFFKEIYGSDKSKADNLLSIIKQENVSPDAVLMIGDSDSDFVAARQVGCQFVGLSNCWNNWDKISKNFNLVSDLREIKELI